MAAKKDRKEGDETSSDAEGRIRWGKRAAGLLIFRADGRVFLTLRSMEVFDPGVWGIPGGRVEPDEIPWTAALEETTEELKSLPSVREVDRTDVYKSGDFTYTTFVVEMSDDDADQWTPELNWENTNWGWFQLDHLPAPIHDNVRRVLGRYV